MISRARFNAKQEHFDEELNPNQKFRRRLIKTLGVFAALACVDGLQATEAFGYETNFDKKIVEGLQYEVFGSPESSNTLIIWLQGDKGSAKYLFGPAKVFGAKGIISAVMARPGCSLDSKRWSWGTHGPWDHYTPKNIEMVAKAIAALKEHYNAKKIVLVGHSGGAATAGVIIGKYPGLVDGTVLVACPANVDKWRSQREVGGTGDNWYKSLSPHKYIDKVPQKTKIILVTGERDSNTTPGLAKEYARKAEELGLSVELIIPPGRMHKGVLRDDQFFDAVRRLISEEKED